MRLGLAMTVKDEANRIEGALGEILDLFDQVVIADTGSTDGTPDLLRDLGVEPIRDAVDPDRCHALADVRNRLFARLDTPWTLSLDADERIERAALDALLGGPEPEAAGLFCAWHTHRAKGGLLLDYKCPIFRKGLEMAGEVHENIQVSIRGAGERAVWHRGLILHHFPEVSKLPAKRARYLRRLRCALRREPDCHRARWFAGYTLLQAGDPTAALPLLDQVAASRSHAFPVECLNAHLVLADLHARAGRSEEVRATLTAASSLHEEVADDFEVQVNFRLLPWLRDAWSAWEAGALDRIRAYEFAC